FFLPQGIERVRAGGQEADDARPRLARVELPPARSSGSAGQRPFGEAGVEHGPGFREIADLAGAQAAARRLPVRAVVARDPDAEPARRVETAIRRENLCDTVGQRAGP